MDKLETIFTLQKELTERIGVRTENLDDAEKVHWVLNYTRAMQQELAELVDSMPWKWWAKYQTFDIQNARIEVIDLLHFIVAIAQTLGMSADDVFKTFKEKNLINHKRQDAGYQVKKEDDCRHI